MSKKSQRLIVKAWRDPVFRSRLSSEKLATIPANPAGSAVDDEFELESVVGGWTFTGGCTSIGCGTDSRCTCNIFCAKTSCSSDVDCQPPGSTVDLNSPACGGPIDQG